MMPCNIWQTTPFHLWPWSTLKSVSIGCTHSSFLLLMFHPLFPPWHHLCILSLCLASPTLSPCWSPTLPIYFHLHNPRSSLNRQGCCGWHVSSWEQPCRVDGPQYTERRDSPTTQPCVYVFVCVFLWFLSSVCLFMWVLVYLPIVYLTEAQLHQWCDSHSMGRHCMCMCMCSFVFSFIFCSKKSWEVSCQRLCYWRTHLLQMLAVRGL